MLLGLNLKHLIFVLPNKCHLGKIECVNLVGKGKGIKGAMRNNESYSVMKSFTKYNLEINLLHRSCHILVD